jgi:hypothetical protein
MLKRRNTYYWTIVLILTGMACQKINSNPDTEDETSNPPAGRLAYSDTLFFNHSITGDKFAPVVSQPVGTALFKAIPGGLSIDSLTGRINISKSESGLRYKIFAVNQQGLAIDSVKLVISGVDYADGIYNLDVTPVAYDTAFPIYNARPELALPCDDDDDDEQDLCVFDETDLDGDGNDDIAGVIQDKLLVDIKRGTIDLEASFRAGLFGSSTPANGSLKTLLMYYRLGDASNKALQKVQLQIYYYRTSNDIPQLLLNELNNRRNQSNEVNGRMTDSFEFQSFLKPKRPPILIIVGGI